MFTVIGMIVIAVIVLFLLGMGIRALTYRSTLRTASGTYTTIWYEWEALAKIPHSQQTPRQRERIRVLDLVIQEMAKGHGIDPTKHAW